MLLLGKTWIMEPPRLNFPGQFDHRGGDGGGRVAKYVV